MEQAHVPSWPAPGTDGIFRVLANAVQRQQRTIEDVLPMRTPADIEKWQRGVKEGCCCCWGLCAAAAAGGCALLLRGCRLF